MRVQPEEKRENVFQDGRSQDLRKRTDFLNFLKKTKKKTYQS
jgi:hypothetical protein